MSKTAAHFIYLNAGEKLFVITDDVAGDRDHHTHVVELVFPTVESSWGEFLIDPRKRIEQVARAAYEMNQIANMTTIVKQKPDGELITSVSIDEAVAYQFTDGFKSKTDEPFVSVPLRMVKKYFPKPDDWTKIKDDFSIFGLEEAKD